MTARFTRGRRAELLAVADRDQVHALGVRLLERLGPPASVIGPEVGVVVMQVREPVCRDRFHLGEVVVSRAEVAWPGADGWAMRLGTDREAALAAAICAAGAEIDVDAAVAVDDLCSRTEVAREYEAALEWEALAATTVRFEELD